MVNRNFWRGKKVFLTGHSGFKGSWMTMTLNYLDAEVYGYSLKPKSDPSLFNECRLDKKSYSKFADIRDYELLKKSLIDFDPDIVIHMAAQPLVRDSYINPIDTYSTNLMGTVNLLNSCRYCKKLKSVVVITTDKCYENIEKNKGYVETDPMGGHDPYSSSKGCAELATSAYSRSFFSKNNSPNIASVRAGNVIGGGDWSKDRLVPDILNCFEKNEKIIVRNPKSVRPWQHVIEPIFGYLLLAEKLYDDKSYVGGWNFGPNYDDCKEVEWIVDKMISKWGNNHSWELDKNFNPHEAKLLMLDCSKAKNILRWRPKWNLSTALDLIIDWHKSWILNDSIYDKSISNIKSYINE